MFKYMCLVLYLAKLSYCANILALVAAVSYSHQIAYTPLWRELSLRGHNVTLLTTDPLNDPKLTNLTELDIKWAYKFSQNGTSYHEHRSSIWNYHQSVFETMYHICDIMLSSNIGQNLLHNNNKFDLVLAEYLCPELLAFAKIYNCPKILISSMMLPSIYSNAIGELTHPILHPEFVTPFYGKLSFKERVLSTLSSWYVYYILAHIVFPKRQKLLIQYFNDTSTIPELISDIDMLFLTVNPLIHGPRRLGPSVVVIGGDRKDISPMQIPKEVKNFLDNAKEGCIFVSLGSNVKSSQLSQRLLKPITDALREVPFKVLWKYEDEVSDLAKNIKTAKWLPQQKVLNHPNVKLFLCQGGLQSIEESIHGEVPFVVIPFFSDQYQNARILENKGIAMVLDRRYLNKDDLKNALLTVMNDPKYRDEVKRLKKLILDEPMTGLEKAVWWTEYVIRNKGAKHLRNPAADLPFYQYYLLDVIGFLLGMIIFIILIVILALRRIYMLMRKLSPEKEKTQ